MKFNYQFKFFIMKIINIIAIFSVAKHNFNNKKLEIFIYGIVILLFGILNLLDGYYSYKKGEKAFVGLYGGWVMLYAIGIFCIIGSIYYLIKLIFMLT